MAGKKQNKKCNMGLNIADFRYRPILTHWGGMEEVEPPNWKVGKPTIMLLLHILESYQLFNSQEGHLYSKPVDIMPKYKNTEKRVVFQGQARTAFRVSKTAKIKKKGMVF